MPLILMSLAIGLGAGLVVGLLGVGGGIVVIPALVYLLGMDQHAAQGTTLFLLLFPLGIGAIRPYWKSGAVNVKAGALCSLGFFLGGYGGSIIAVPMSSRDLKGAFGCFLMLVAVLLWRKTVLEAQQRKAREETAPHG